VVRFYTYPTCHCSGRPERKDKCGMKKKSNTSDAEIIHIPQWDELRDSTDEELQVITDKYGNLATNFKEFGKLLRRARTKFRNRLRSYRLEGEPSNNTNGVVVPTDGLIIETADKVDVILSNGHPHIGYWLLQSQDTYNLTLRICYSLAKLKSDIKSINLDDIEANSFYLKLQNVLRFLYDGDNPNTHYLSGDSTRHRSPSRGLGWIFVGDTEDNGQKRIDALIKEVRGWDARLTKKDSNQDIIHIDLNRFNKTLSYTLLIDLLKDIRREGVIWNKERHGRQQPQGLKAVLKAAGYENIVIKKRNNKIILGIPMEKITTYEKK
jgi:hypothetical protein